MASHKPNILLIMSDQHRIDCLGAYGNQDIKTPNIDALAEKAVVYENSFCSSPLCTPSRYSLITGLYPHQHLGFTNYCTIPPKLDTFPRLLKEQGYKTKAIGKMHYTPTYLDVGFEDMELAEQNGEGRYEDDYHHYLREHNLVDEIDLIDQVDEYREEAPQEYWDTLGAMESNLPEEHHSTTWIGDKALDSINRWENDSNDANFLMVSFIKPHHPFDPPYPWSEMYDPEDLDILPGWTSECLERDLEFHEGFFKHSQMTEEQLKRAMAYYYASISQIDDYVGKMTKLLKEKGLYEDTMIVYTSDHGEYLGFHHLLLKQNHMYDPVIKVPLIIKYPADINREERSQDLVTNIDLAPTFLSVAGVEKGEFMPGTDISNLKVDREYVFAEQGRGLQYMIRSKNYKLLFSKDKARCQFFDLNKDPLELENLYHDTTYSDEIKAHKEELFNMLLFETLPSVYLDPEAPEISSETSNKERDKESMKDWIRKQMN